MSQLKQKFETVKGEKVLKNVYILGGIGMYVTVKEPRPIFDQANWPNPDQFEYKASIIVDEETADEWDSIFPKQEAKKFQKAQFMKKFKLETDEDFPKGVNPKDKKFWVITVTQKAQYFDKKTKELKKFSKEMLPKVVMIEEGKPVDRTTTLVGNGSAIDLMVRASHNAQYGTFSHLAVVKVNELVPYAGGKGSGDDDLEEFLGGKLEKSDEDEFIEGDGQDEDQGSEPEEEDADEELY